MLRKQPVKASKQRRRRVVRFRGICNDAKALGVHRIHLYLVLSGQRDSKPLIRRYRKLKEAA